MRKRLIFGSGVLLLAILVTLVVWQGSFTFGLVRSLQHPADLTCSGLFPR